MTEDNIRMQIVGLSGSLRERSYTRMALSAALRGASMTGP